MCSAPPLRRFATSASSSSSSLPRYLLLGVFLLAALVVHSFTRLSPHRLSNALSTPQTAPRALLPAPHAPLDRALWTRNANRTLFIVPGIENDCKERVNYVCKFWYFVRCHLLAGFPNVRMLTRFTFPKQLREAARPGDVVLMPWRNRRHKKEPKRLEDVRQAVPPGVTIGVFHVANEQGRTNWPWYTQVDFVIRNYWLPNLPRHVVYAPLGGQVDAARCESRVSGDSVAFLPPGAISPDAPPQPSVCDCDTKSLHTASSRRYVWGFGGSLKRQRGELLQRVRASRRLAGRGWESVHEQFGGDGKIGEAGDPKTEYLAHTVETRFVFAPCGNVMETHRIYEALMHGAIPVIENCEPLVAGFFPFSELVFGSVRDMVRFVERLADRDDETDALQARVMQWWGEYSLDVARNITAVVDNDVPPEHRSAV